MKEVHWKSRLTEETGHGSPLPDDVAEEAVKIGNSKHPEIYH